LARFSHHGSHKLVKFHFIFNKQGKSLGYRPRLAH
jgi:hypothetical protein